jgi:hypothetical protein
MAKTAIIAMRVSNEMKAAAEKAAQDDRRSMSSYVERLLYKHLKDTGYLEPKE